MLIGDFRIRSLTEEEKSRSLSKAYSVVHSAQTGESRTQRAGRAGESRTQTLDLRCTTHGPFGRGAVAAMHFTLVGVFERGFWEEARRTKHEADELHERATRRGRSASGDTQKSSAACRYGHILRKHTGLQRRCLWSGQRLTWVLVRRHCDHQAQGRFPPGEACGGAP